MNKMKEIIKEIEKFSTIIIHGHKRPDGDCYGSQFGLKALINANYPSKKVYLVGGKCDYCSFLGQMDIVEDDLFKDALSIVVDTATDERVDDARFSLAKKVIKIDHHIVVNHFGDIEYVEEDAASCTQVITDIAIAGKWEITKVAAFALYVGLVTDTGRFRFDSVTSHTMSIAATLLDKGVSPDRVDNYLSVDTLSTLKLKGYVLSNFVTTPHGFVYIKMTREVIEKFGVTDEEAANQVSSLAGIEGFPVWAIFMEYGEDEIRIRLRSRGPIISTLAEKYEGGGHAKASGAKLNSWDDLQGFVDLADNIAKTYLKENPEAK